MAAQETWSIFNSVAKAAIGQPNLKGKALVQTFLDIEDQITYAVDLLVDHTTFVEDNLCYLMAEIALGMIKSRKVYRGKRDQARVDVGLGQTIGRPNLHLLSRGFDLYKLSKLPREEAAPVVRRVLKTMSLNYSVYENIVRAFFRETKDYVDLSDRLTEAQLVLEYEDLSDRDVEILTDRIEDLKDELALVEQSVGAVRKTRMYGIIRIVHGCMERIAELQSRVQRAYQKMIPKPARNKSINETESLDLFQAGSLGLSRAISLFDIHDKSGFPTFAQRWINQKIMSAAKLSSPLIRLPWSFWETYQKIRRQELKFESDPKMRHVYTDEDVARAIGKSLKSVRKVKERVASVRMVSLDSLVRKEDGLETDLTVGSALIDQRLEDSKQVSDYREQIRDLLKFLSDRERTMVCLRFGLIEEIENDGISPKEASRELLRQAACRATTYQFLTSRSPHS